MESINKVKDYYNKVQDFDLPRRYYKSRLWVVDSVYSIPWLKFLEHSVFFHLALFSLVIVIITCHFSQQHARKLNLVAFHILLMSTGSFILLGESIAVFRNGFLVESFAPIMQHSKKVKVRSIHQSMSMTGGIFIFLGYIFIISNKIEEGDSIFPTSIHGIFGTFVILLAIVQSYAGFEKLSIFRRYNTKIYRWHNDLGLFIWDLLGVTAALGCLLNFSWTMRTFVSWFFLAVAWIALYFQIKKKLPDFEEDPFLKEKEIAANGGSAIPTSDDDDINNEQLEENTSVSSSLLSLAAKTDENNDK